jgi:hypothetical protein
LNRAAATPIRQWSGVKDNTIKLLMDFSLYNPIPMREEYIIRPKVIYRLNGKFFSHEKNFTSCVLLIFELNWNQLREQQIMTRILIL